MSKPTFRGSRKKKRSTRGRRLTPAEKVARAAACKHRSFRYRNRSTEAVCVDCGSVQKIQGTGMNIQVVEGWKFETEEEPEHEPTCNCIRCRLKREQGNDQE